MDPRVGLPLCKTGVSAVASADAGKELLGCRAKGTKHRETERHKVEAVTSTHLGVLVPLRLLNNSKSGRGIPPTPACRRDSDKVDTAMAVITPPVEEDVSRAGEPGATAGLRPLIPRQAQPLWLDRIDDTCLSQELAQSLLNQAMAELEPCGGRVPAAEEGMVTENVHGGLTTRAVSTLWEHRHGEAVPQEGAVMETTEGLL